MTDCPWISILLNIKALYLTQTQRSALYAVYTKCRPREHTHTVKRKPADDKGWSACFPSAVGNRKSLSAIDWLLPARFGCQSEKQAKCPSVCQLSTALAAGAKQQHLPCS